MSVASDTPTFNLKAVVQETDLKPDTLRAWERRYGLPQPERTSGGHRLYSQRDIDTLKWLLARQDEGLSISRAVALWRELEESSVDPLLEFASSNGEKLPPAMSLEVGDTLVQLRDSWIEYCLDYEEQKAEYVLAQAFALYSPETVCIELLQKGLARIGAEWYSGRATAQQEHFASALAMRRLESLLAATPPPTRPGRVLIGCPPLEEHTFSPLLLTLLLRRRGWEALYLGSNVPLLRMEATIARNKPRLVILSAQTLFTAAHLLEMGELLQREQVPLAFGGLIFIMAPTLIDRIPGHYLGSDLASAPLLIEQLMISPTMQPARLRVSRSYIASLHEYRQMQAQIEAHVWEKLQDGRITQIELKRANFNMARDITAALSLGDMSLLGYNLDWVTGLMTNHNYPVDSTTLQDYVNAYYESTQEALADGSTNEALTWLRMLVHNTNGQHESC
ncbi:MAG: MerR family transcriptional regulator [Ardenticatenaceae bacterium]|nr:MerR family transcriptional regulator [Anaerolineales bacterium]MCB8917070.1 MerR family transcriptional regulator [Ardenticatenaceae bacterium]